MQKAIIICQIKQEEEIKNILDTNEFTYNITRNNHELVILIDIEEYQINLLINIIKSYQIIRLDTKLYISYREI